MILGIRQIRIDEGWTLQYVADYVGLTKSAIHDIEIGRRKPSYDVLVKLEELFEKPHTELFKVAQKHSHRNNNTKHRKRERGK